MVEDAPTGGMDIHGLRKIDAPGRMGPLAIRPTFGPMQIAI